MSSWDNKLAVILPAYNESKNLRILLRKINKVVPHAHIFVVDDSSPPENSKELTSMFSNVKVLTRQKKLGRGSAVLDGFAHALKNKSLEYFVEMDTDLSHNPLQIPLLYQTLIDNKAQIAIGSRYLQESKIVKWPVGRIIASKIINFNLSLWLGVKLHDFTNGYRMYKRSAVTELVKEGLREKGFIALSESAYILNRKGYKIIEVPITFVDRIYGNSTVDARELSNSLVGAFRIRFRDHSSKRKKSA